MILYSLCLFNLSFLCSFSYGNFLLGLLVYMNLWVTWDFQCFLLIMCQSMFLLYISYMMGKVFEVLLQLAGPSTMAGIVFGSSSLRAVYGSWRGGASRKWVIRGHTTTYHGDVNHTHLSVEAGDKILPQPENNTYHSLWTIVTADRILSNGRYSLCRELCIVHGGGVPRGNVSYVGSQPPTKGIWTVHGSQ